MNDDELFRLLESQTTAGHVRRLSAQLATVKTAMADELVNVALVAGAKAERCQRAINEAIVRWNEWRRAR